MELNFIAQQYSVPGIHLHGGRTFGIDFLLFVIPVCFRPVPQSGKHDELLIRSDALHFAGVLRILIGDLVCLPHADAPVRIPRSFSYRQFLFLSSPVPGM
jgi:hypothetical protein